MVIVVKIGDRVVMVDKINKDELVFLWGWENKIIKI